MTSHPWWLPTAVKHGCAIAYGSRSTVRVATRLIAISRYVADQLVEFGVNLIESR